MDKMRISLYELLLCLSNAEDLVTPNLNNHHQQTAYLAYHICEMLNLPPEEVKQTFFAALVHDIGALSISEKLEIVEDEPMAVNRHAFRGAKLLENFEPLTMAARIIKYHHLPWNGGDGLYHKGEKVPYASHIIHLADRVSAGILSSENVLSKSSTLIRSIRSRSGTDFCPELVEALEELGRKEYIWLDLAARSPIQNVPDIGLFSSVVLDMADITALAFIFSQIIDFRSSFTARHSAGVAKTAEQLARLIGFSPYDCQMMLIAGYLHDLGKLAIDNALLEKPGKLNEEEYTQIRSHTYYTYNLLSTIKQFETINAWASFHHEKLNGNGYPFHIGGDNLSLGSRIMAVADIFTAITEDRPYRTGMANGDSIRVLKSMVENGAIDGKIVDVLISDFDEINFLRKLAQQTASERYRKFMEEDL